MAFTILVKIHSPDARRTMMCIFFLSFSQSTTFFFFFVPCIKTFHGTSMQCLHQATLKSTNNRFNQGPFIKSVFSAHEKEKKNLQKIQKREGAPLPSCQQRTMVAEMKEAINRVCEAGLSRALAGLFNWRRGCLESVGSRCHSSLPESEKTFAERWFRHFTWHHLLDFIKNLAWSFHT